MVKQKLKLVRGDLEQKPLYGLLEEFRQSDRKIASLRRRKRIIENSMVIGSTILGLACLGYAMFSRDSVDEGLRRHLSLSEEYRQYDPNLDGKLSKEELDFMKYCRSR